MSMLDFPKNIQVRDRATLFNLVIGLNGFMVSSGVIDSKLNGSNIIARPLKKESVHSLKLWRKDIFIYFSMMCNLIRISSIERKTEDI